LYQLVGDQEVVEMLFDKIPRDFDLLLSRFCKLTFEKKARVLAEFCKLESRAKPKSSLVDGCDSIIKAFINITVEAVKNKCYQELLEYVELCL
jgi:hypothetical protein